MSNAPEQQHPVAASVSTSIGFAMMCVGMFMAILDVQVVATSLPTIQSALDIPPDQMSWVQTAYLIAEVVAIPLTGLLTRLLEHVLAVRAVHFRLYAGFGGLRRERPFPVADRMAGFAGLFRGHVDPERLFGGVPSISGQRDRALRPRSPACWRCLRRPSGRSSAVGLPRPIPGTGCS